MLRQYIIETITILTVASRKYAVDPDEGAGV